MCVYVCMYVCLCVCLKVFDCRQRQVPFTQIARLVLVVELLAIVPAAVVACVFYKVMSLHWIPILFGSPPESEILLVCLSVPTHPPPYSPPIFIPIHFHVSIDTSPSFYQCTPDQIRPPFHSLFLSFSLSLSTPGQLEGYGVYIYSSIGPHPNDRSGAHEH